MKTLEEIVESVTWRKTDYVCPHEYILYRDYPEECVRLSNAITKSPLFDLFRCVKHKNLYIGEYKYWKTGSVINRRKAKLVLHFVLMTMCAKCRLLMDGTPKPFKREYPNAIYVLGYTEREIRFPLTGEVTAPAEAIFTPKEGEEIMTYRCNKVDPSELMFIQPVMAEYCRFYTGK